MGDAGIFHRDGPAGPRAVLPGGPDVWEVIAAARTAPEHGDDLAPALADRLGLPPGKITAALAYYDEHPAEIDGFITANQHAAERAHAVAADRPNRQGDSE